MSKKVFRVADIQSLSVGELMEVRNMLRKYKLALNIGGGLLSLLVVSSLMFSSFLVATAFIIFVGAVVGLLKVVNEGLVIVEKQIK